jgi:hypothetical protein
MPEIGTSGSKSGDWKRSAGHRPQATAPILDSVNSYKVIMSRRPKFMSTSIHKGSRLRSITASPSGS